MNKHDIERTVSYNQSQKLDPDFLNHVSAGTWSQIGGRVSFSGISDGYINGSLDF